MRLPCALIDWYLFISSLATLYPTQAIPPMEPCLYASSTVNPIPASFSLAMRLDL
jgi:hypothetical protein